MELSVPVILGTARDGRESEAVAKFVLDHATSAQSDVDFSFVDVRDFPLTKTKPAWEDHEQTASWKQAAEAADGYIIVTPEYNHGPPGELKLFLDSAFREYFDKPVGLIGVSAGNFGGARVVESLKPMLMEMGMNPLSKAAYVSKVSEAFPDGEIDPETKENFTEQLDPLLNSLVDYAQALKAVQE